MGKSLDDHRLMQYVRTSGPIKGIWNPDLKPSFRYSVQSYWVSMWGRAKGSGAEQVPIIPRWLKNNCLDMLVPVASEVPDPFVFLMPEDQAPWKACYDASPQGHDGWEWGPKQESQLCSNLHLNSCSPYASTERNLIESWAQLRIWCMVQH